ncbi:MAG TPA: hypothetical protein VGV87_25680 [Blastocatellia bacterium]|nr:hypothetical protein [Blastocatellia bacterium]
MSTSIIIGLIVVGVVAAIVISIRLRRRREKQNPHERAYSMEREAQRFSRRLVSDIKLYNKARVADGRQSHDLYYQLREELDRARTMYEEKVDSLAVDRDYFREAVVEILCDGDADVLGAELPGPRGRTIQ